MFELLRKSAISIPCFVVFSLMSVVGYAYGETEAVQADGLLLYASFSGGLEPETNTTGVPLEWHGDVRFAEGEGVDGTGALRLGMDGYGVIDKGVVNPDRGSLAFWFKPMGDPWGGSHTFLSWKWDQEYVEGGHSRNHYAVLSQGWWEGGGHGHNTMFMIINPFREQWAYPPLQGQWVHFAFTWRRKDDGQYVINGYRNGITTRTRVSDDLPRRWHEFFRKASFKPASSVYLGSDKGTPLSAGRFANGYFNDLVFYERALDKDEVDLLFLKNAPESILQEREDPLAWMGDVLAQPYLERRESDGTLLEGRMLFSAGRLIHLRPKNLIENDLDRVRESGFNTLMPVVNAKGVAECVSDVFPAGRRWLIRESEYPDGVEPYQYFIDEAHKRGMEVHSCFHVMRVGPPRPAVTDLKPPFQLPDSLWTNAYDPEFRDYFVRGVIDHVLKYNVDGVNLDYIRAQDGIRSPEAAAEYRRIYDRDISEDLGDSERMAEFTSYIIADIVKRVSEGIKSVRPDIVLSVCAKPQLASWGLAGNGRNPLLWVNNGWIDLVINMDYGVRLGVESMDQAREDSIRPDAWVVGLGNWDTVGGENHPRCPEVFSQLVDYVRRKYGNGVFTYMYSWLSDEQIEALGEGPFSEWAEPDWSRASSESIIELSD